jgi:hypothetical protein
MTKTSEIKFIADEMLDHVAGGFVATDDLWVKSNTSKSGSGFVAWEDVWPGVKNLSGTDLGSGR